MSFSFAACGCDPIVGNETIVTAVDHKPKRTPRLQRLENIRTNPSVTLLVDHYDDDWTAVWWVRVDGTATLHDSHEQGRELLAAKYPQYAEAPEHLGRMVVIHPTKWTSWAYSDPV